MKQARNLAQRKNQLRQLEAIGAVEKNDFHDACGVGICANINGKASREILDLALQGLKAVRHRGAVAADGLTGDGAGVKIQISQNFFHKAALQLVENDEDLTNRLHNQAIGVGMIFLPRADQHGMARIRSFIQAALKDAGFLPVGFREVPVRPEVIGRLANEARPKIEQILFLDETGSVEPQQKDTAEQRLYVARRVMEKRARALAHSDFYICSLSMEGIVYKGMILGDQLDAFYPDLRDEAMQSPYAIFHQRYSTNTIPEWKLAQPFRMLAHNGEINTVAGNINWLRGREAQMASHAFNDKGDAVKDIISDNASDSKALDQVFEMLVQAGREVPMVKALMMPEAWSKRHAVLKTDWRKLYEYCNSVMEPWDGPAAIAACDGHWAIAGLDRNGLRPLRYCLTRDGVFAAGSEAGLWGFPADRIDKLGAINTGRMVALDLKAQKFYSEAEILDRLSSDPQLDEWVEHVEALDEQIMRGAALIKYGNEERERRLVAAGITYEDIDMVLTPMAVDGKEAIGSMGDDSPLAALSERWRPMAHFFRQKFSQVTNPPIDPLREEGVMSLKTRFKNLGNIFAEKVQQRDIYTLESPILGNGMSQELEKFFGDKAVTIDCTVALNEATGDGAAYYELLDNILTQAVAAIESGIDQLILTDENQSEARMPGPMVLLVSALHQELSRLNLRASCSLHIRSAEIFDAHGCAVLVGMGATTVNPYLLFDQAAALAREGRFGELDPTQASRNIKQALDSGLLKILSKMGVSVISSYRGSRSFEAVGLSHGLVARYFPGVPSRISGISIAGLEGKAATQHRAAWIGERAVMAIGGFYRQRSAGEAHALEANIIKDLQKAVRRNDPSAYDSFKQSVESRGEERPLQIRELLRFDSPRPAIDPDQVESLESIRQRFVTPGMSLGALSPEAHGALNIAMNRIGARSVSGEGGEDPLRYITRDDGDNANSRVKQIASGRFGVNAHYLNQCDEIEIKVAQGAKPGEGGQLPGFKVTDFIARMRCSTPGVTLISPPPHHDIYSIEDLAQLIYDLKQINPDARVCVKLVASVGIGTIAAGVAKASADIIHVAGHNGGTGASPLTSIKFAGSPWEIGLPEVHQQLLVNDLRERVRIRTDGGLRTGRDIVIAAILGADEFAFGTISLVALGCLMVRQCHSNVCPVGVCTQSEELRQRFMGLPDHVIRYVDFIAQDVRGHLAQLGYEKLSEVIGKTHLLKQMDYRLPHLAGIDLRPILANIGKYSPYGDGLQRPPIVQVPDTLDQEIFAQARPYLEQKKPVEIRSPVYNHHRSIGTGLSSYIVRNFGPDNAPPDGLKLKLSGSAGQSLGAFGTKGLRIELEGDANDYVGKGLSGANLVIRPARTLNSSHEQAIIGNTCLYGATSGSLFAAGRAGERFAVRNSGAVAVIEGCGSNGCEYMTGGVALILGSVGDNFAAGMSGGCAFVLDENNQLEKVLNPDFVLLCELSENEDWLHRVKKLIQTHIDWTGSAHAHSLLDHWAITQKQIKWILPKEIEKKLDEMRLPELLKAS